MADALPVAGPLEAPSGRYRRLRVRLADGRETTVHVSGHDPAVTEVRVVVLRGQARLAAWCAARGVREALVGGFFTRPEGIPLGHARGDLLEAGPLLVAGGVVALRARAGSGGLLGRRAAVRLRHHRRPPPARFADGRARLRDRDQHRRRRITTLISGGRLRNRPRGDYERPEAGGRPVSTALLLTTRA